MDAVTVVMTVYEAGPLFIRMSFLIIDLHIFHILHVNIYDLVGFRNSLVTG